MVDLQLVIAGPATEEPIDPILLPTDGYATEQHRRRSVDAIDRLDDVWETVVERLSALAATARRATSEASFELDKIEFNVGIEAGINVGFVTKADAAVTLTFTRKKPDGTTGDLVGSAVVKAD
jgi:hypothetical protein